MHDESLLLERAKEYDPEALGEIYDAYFDKIYRYVYRYLGEARLAEDLTADVFLRLLEAIKASRPPRTNLSAWLYRVAHNLVVDLYRRRPPREPEALDNVVVPIHDHSEACLERQEMVARARAALQRLTPLQQQVIVLRFLEGMSLEDVAQVVNRTVGAVKSSQHRALNSLRHILEEENEA